MKLPNINCDQCKNASCLLRHISNASLCQELNNEKRIIFFNANQKILVEGMPFEDVSILQNGKVKVYKYGLNKKVQIIRLSKSGDLIGHRGFYRNKMPITAKTIEASSVCMIPKTLFTKLLACDLKFVNKLMQFYAEELYDSEVLTLNHAHMTVKELIADTLIRIIEAYGLEKKSNALNVKLSRQEIAEIAGTTKEQVSKYLYEFQEEGLILIKGKQIILCSLEGLKKIVIEYQNS